MGVGHPDDVIHIRTYSATPSRGGRLPRRVEHRLLHPVQRGRVTGVSDEVLDAIARALRLSDAEHEHLRNLARPTHAAKRHARTMPTLGASVFDRSTSVEPPTRMRRWSRPVLDAGTG